MTEKIIELTCADRAPSSFGRCTKAVDMRRLGAQDTYQARRVKNALVRSPGYLSRDIDHNETRFHARLARLHAVRGGASQAAGRIKGAQVEVTAFIL